MQPANNPVPPLLSVQNLSVQFGKGEKAAPALKNVSFQLQRGKLLALVGESGSGKSVTALSVLQLLPQPPAQYTAGQIIFNDGNSPINLITATTAQLQALRGARIGTVFQEPMTALNPVMRCGQQIAEVLLQHKTDNKKEAWATAIEWLEKVRLPNPAVIAKRYPHQLSGGQKQRVMIAMAMCCNPALLICDEPTTALDVTVQQSVLELIKNLQQEFGTAVLFITHDLGVVAQIADDVAVMYKGEIVEQGSAATIFSAPQHPYTKALIACRPAAHPKGEPLPTISDFLSNTGGVEKGFVPATISRAAPVVQVKNLVVQYPAEKNIWGRTTKYFRAVDDVSFEIFEGETFGLVGESGCGKTTLGRSLLRLITPASGSIIINNEDVTQKKEAQLQAFRKEVQLVFQDPYSSLNPRLTVGNALAEPMAVHGLQKGTKAQQQKVKTLLDAVGLPAAAAQRYPHQFSGGQRQRIVIARALALNPTILVCDESVSALDVSVQAQVLNLLNDLKKDLGLTMVFISHDLSVVHYMCDRIAVMQAGKFAELGTADEIYHHPKSSYTQSLIRAIPKVAAHPPVPPAQAGQALPGGKGA